MPHSCTDTAQIFEIECLCYGFLGSAGAKNAFILGRKLTLAKILVKMFEKNPYILFRHNSAQETITKARSGKNW